MRRSVVAMVVVLAGLVGSVRAEDILDQVKTGCKSELDTYCSKVTPGEGRLLACLYAYDDKLSGKCEFALYDAAAQLDRAMAALNYAATECDPDIEKFCADTAPGEGRIAKCLGNHRDKLSGRCRDAGQQLGFWK